MGVAPDITKCALRISFGRDNSMSDVAQILEALRRLRANTAAVGKVLAA